MGETSSDDQTLMTLMSLRELTRTTGGIHELQVQQLKRWPLILWGPATSRFKVDLNKKTIRFDVERSGAANKSVFRGDRHLILATWTKTILGDEWTIKTRLMSGKKRRLVERDFPPGSLE